MNYRPPDKAVSSTADQSVGTDVRADEGTTDGAATGTDDGTILLAGMDTPPVADSSRESSQDVPPHHTSNFALLISYMVTMRTGWIFKTESIIMPAVLDVIGGAGWLRGCLPMLNRFGQSIPPMLASDLIRSSSRKKRWLTSMTLVMGLCFLTLSAIWAVTGGTAGGWLPFVFLVMYAIFFAATGINMLVLNTLKGKLIRTRRRGLLDLTSNVVGATVAVGCAWFLLTIWLSGTDDGSHPPNFTMLFLFTGAMFVVSAGVSCFFFEEPDSAVQQKRNSVAIFRAAAETLKTDRNFRTLAIVGMSFGMCLTLFPHYQSLGRSRLTLGLTALIPWVIAQNIGTALFSIPTGWGADKFGNRRVLNLLMLALCVAPLLALILARYEMAGRGWFTLVFVLLGLTPVTIRTLNNYTLELAGNEDHPRYLSTLSLCIAAPPVLLSTAMGWMVDRLGFEPVFMLATACIASGWLLTFRLTEPRDGR